MGIKKKKKTISEKQKTKQKNLVHTDEMTI